MRVTAMRTGLAALPLSMPAGGAAWAQMYNEAPMLAAMVQAGSCRRWMSGCRPIRWWWSRSTRSAPTAAR